MPEFYLMDLTQDQMKLIISALTIASEPMETERDMAMAKLMVAMSIASGLNVEVEPKHQVKREADWFHTYPE